MRTCFYELVRPLCFALLVIAAWYGLISIWQWREDAVTWANEPIVYGPVDWKEKLKDCERRARLIGGMVEAVEDDRYCIAKL